MEVVGFVGVVPKWIYCAMVLWPFNIFRIIQVWKLIINQLLKEDTLLSDRWNVDPGFCALVCSYGRHLSLE
jgi:hypothetical protein